MKLYTIDFDMDHVLTDYQKAFDENYTDKQQFPQAEARFFDDLLPLESNGIINLAYVKSLIDYGHTIRIVTSPSIPNINCWTGKAYWIKKYFDEDMLKNLIITYDKSITSSSGDILVDDSINNGQESYKDGFIRYGSKEYPNMKSVYEEILERSKNNW